MDDIRKSKTKVLAEHMADPVTFAVDSRDQNVVQMVENAIADNRVLLAYQPVVQAGTRGHVAFSEGLLRVLDETRRIIPAAQFIHAVEDRESGRILDCLALKMGINALRRRPKLRLSINMSARSIGYPRWMRILSKGLDSDDSVGPRLIFEITETSAMTVPEYVSSFMTNMQCRGVSFALDNFGRGQIALRHLRDFYFDILKIDGQFVRDVESNADNQVLIDSIVAISRAFDMFTVAERVETEAEARWLTSAGVDCLQGFLFGAPTTRPDWANGKRKAA